MTKMDNIQRPPQEQPPQGLALLRVAFPAHQISKLPKATKAQTEALKAAMDRKDFSVGVRCKLCGQWHHKDVVHLDYVGHAALTDRLLDCDPLWNWEPVAVTQFGVPSLDENGGMWIRLTVCGVTRLGYGHADGKKGSGTRVARTFPVIHEWDGTAEVMILDESITKDVFTRYLEEAGKFIGIGRFRPRNGGFYGRFSVGEVLWESC